MYLDIKKIEALHVSLSKARPTMHCSSSTYYIASYIRQPYTETVHSSYSHSTSNALIAVSVVF